MMRSSVPGSLFLLLVAFSLPALLQGVPQLDLSGLVGETVRLPCKVDTETCGDMHSIKWYRGSSRIYVFSEMSNIAHAEGDYTARAELHYTANSTQSTLEVKKLQVADEAVYKCEITYIEVRDGCSVVQFINLTALIKPEYVKVTRGDGTEVADGSTIGPFNEGDELTLVCESGGGKPIPSVYWWNGTHKMHGEYEAMSEGNSVGTGRNRIRVALGRGDLGARYECRAHNAALDAPMLSSTKVLVNVRPLSLKLSGVEKHVVQGSLVTLRCEVKNALPAANITWYNGTTPYHEMDVDPETNTYRLLEKINPDKTVTTISDLIFAATLYENGVTIRCEGINAVMQAKDEKPLKSSLTLEVLYPPIVEISSNVDFDNVTVNETTDISLYCSYVANPTALKSVKWYRDRQKVELSPDHYVGSEDDTALLIKNATRYDQGAYTCVVANSVGLGESKNSIYVSVYYKPQVRLLMDPPSPVSELDALNITLTCKVESGNPDTLLAVRWYLGGEILKELPDCGNASNSVDSTFCDIDPSKLLLEDVVRGFHGNYSCEGKNEAGWGPLSPEEELVVYYPPGPATLVYEPARVVKKSTVTLSCSVDDPGRPETTTFRWTRGSHHIHDVITANWTIGPVTLETQSNFTCLAYNEGGEGEPASVSINVSAPPVFIDRLLPYYGALLTSKHINISCRVECSPLCSIKWLKNNKMLDTGEGTRYYVIEETLPSDLRSNDFESIRSILVWNMSAWEGGQLDRIHDNANYTCQSSGNEVGSGVQSTTVFGVEYPPENISVSSRIVNVVENNIPGKVRCIAKAYPNATYQWQRVSQPQEPPIKGNILHLNYALTRHKSGNYTCIATNKHGSIAQNITINVQYKPECGISQSESDGKLVLTCTATANPPEVDFVWHIKGENESIEENVFKKGYQSQLILESYENFRTYICVANNSIGTSIQCERDVTGHVISWWKNFESDNYKIIIAVIVGAILMVIIVCIIIIVVCRRKRADDKCPNPSATKDKSKQDLASSPSDGLLQSDGDKAFYENLPFHGMQSAPNKPVPTSSISQAASRPSSQLSQYGSSGYGSTRSHMGPHLQKSQSLSLVAKEKFNSLRLHPHKRHYPQFYSMRLHHRHRNRIGVGNNKKQQDRQPEKSVQLLPISSREKLASETESQQLELNTASIELNNNAKRPPDKPQMPIPAPRKQIPSKTIVHTYQNVPIPVGSKPQELTMTQSQLQRQQQQHHHHHYNLTSQHHLLMNPTNTTQFGSTRRSHSSRNYLPPMRLEYQQPYYMADPYVSDSVVYADLALSTSGGRREPHLPSDYRPQQTPTEYAILKFHDVGQEIDV